MDQKEGRVPKNRCFQTMVLKNTLENSLDRREIKAVSPKGNQPWIFIGRTDAVAEVPILWPPYGKSQFIGKDSDAVKDWGQKEKRVTEDEMVGWHHWLNECDFEQTPGDSEGQGGLVCSSVSCSHKSRAWVIDWTITRLFKGLLWPDGLEGNFGGAAGETQEEKYRTASAQATVLSQCWGERPSVGILLIVLVGKGLRLLVFPSVEWIWHMQRVTPVAPHFTLKAMMQNPR